MIEYGLFNYQSGMKIGFCFLVRNNISWENIWSKFFTLADTAEYSIYIHAKSNVVHTSLENVFVDPNPVETEWASVSLVKATKQLLTTAFKDECDSVIFLSGDSLPLWNFQTIQSLCCETLFSLQPNLGLSTKQSNQVKREFDRIRSFYKVKSTLQLVKQNMFFCIKKDDFQLIKDVEIDTFPSKEVPDEYFWANQLIIKAGKFFENLNFMFANDDPTKTQALSWIVDKNLLHHARSKGYIFIRKVTDFSDKQSKEYYQRLIC